MAKIYRLEHKDTLRGLWRDSAGNYSPIFTQCPNIKCATMPMPYHNRYRMDDKCWFCATPTIEALKYWLNKEDLVDLEKLGYKVYEFDVEDFKQVSDYEVVFIRSKYERQREMSIKSIWEE